MPHVNRDSTNISMGAIVVIRRGISRPFLEDIHDFILAIMGLCGILLDSKNQKNLTRLEFVEVLRHHRNTINGCPETPLLVIYTRYETN